MFHSFGSSIFDAEAMRVMQMIDEWETLYQRGKLFRRNWVFSVVFKR